MRVTIEVGTIRRMCDRCDGGIVSGDRYLLVRDSAYFSGGRVRICRSCAANVVFGKPVKVMNERR